MMMNRLFDLLCLVGLACVVFWLVITVVYTIWQLCFVGG